MRHGREATRHTIEPVSMRFDHDVMVPPAVPLRPNSGLPEFGTLIGRSRIYPTSAGERWTCWLDLSETHCRIRFVVRRLGRALARPNALQGVGAREVLDPTYPPTRLSHLIPFPRLTWARSRTPTAPRQARRCCICPRRVISSQVC